VRFRVLIGSNIKIFLSIVAPCRYRVLVGKPEVKSPFGRPRRRWENGIRFDLEYICWGVLSRFNWLIIGAGSWLLWMRWWAFELWCHGVSLSCVVSFKFADILEMPMEAVNTSENSTNFYEIAWRSYSEDINLLKLFLLKVFVLLVKWPSSNSGRRSEVLLSFVWRKALCRKSVCAT
jgi:hypothetical protein